MRVISSLQAGRLPISIGTEDNTMLANIIPQMNTVDIEGIKYYLSNYREEFRETIKKYKQLVEVTSKWQDATELTQYVNLWSLTDAF